MAATQVGFRQLISPLTSLTLTGTSSPTYSAGRMFYDTTNDCFTAYNSDSNVSLQIGQEEWIRVVNNTGGSIGNGVPVYINGASSGTPTIALAQANTLATARAVGLTTETIANGGTGYVTMFGNVHNVNTSTFSVGPIYLSAASSGTLTQTAPTGSNYVIQVGYVTSVNASTGIINVFPGTPVSASGGGGTPGGSSTQVQYNNASAFAGATQVLIDTTDNNLTLKSTGGTTAVTAPSAGNAKVFTLNRTGQDRLAVSPSVGTEHYLQPSLARKSVSFIDPFSTFGFGYLANATFAPSTSNAFITYSATNLLPNYNARRATTGTTSGTAAGMSVGNSAFTIGTTTYGGGTTMTVVFGLSTYNANQRIYIGIIGSANLGALPSGGSDPTTFVNIFGLGKNVADTTFQVMNNAGSGTATKTNTAITPNQNDVYILTIFIPSNSTSMYLTLEDYSKTAVTIYNSGAITTNIPVAGGYGPLIWISNGSTAAARVIDTIQVTTESYF